MQLVRTLSIPILTAALTVSAHAQKDIAGKGQFPQLRTVSGLGTSLTSSGRPTSMGAVSFSTPIGYTMSDWSIQVVAGTTSADGSFRGVDSGGTGNHSNGSAAVAIGIPTGLGALCVSNMQTSRLSEDRIWNFQFSPAGQRGATRYAVGVMDAFDQSVTTPDYHEKDTSWFAAATHDFGKGMYGSAGIGTRRFSKGFVNFSAPVGRKVRGVIEHDGYNWNTGVAFEISSMKGVEGRASHTVGYLGLTRGKYATWTVGISF